MGQDDRPALTNDQRTAATMKQTVRSIVRGKAEGKGGDTPQGVVMMLAFDSMADATQ
jgi:hypothetical protein